MHIHLFPTNLAYLPQQTPMSTISPPACSAISCFGQEFPLIRAYIVLMFILTFLLFGSNVLLGEYSLQPGTGTFLYSVSTPLSLAGFRHTIQQPIYIAPDPP